MTVSSTTRKAGPFIGDSAATVFPFVFKCFARSDIVATLTVIATGEETELVLDSDYTVALNGDQDASPGGSVTYNPSGTPMTAANNLTLTSDVPQTQGASITNGSGFFPKTIENALDRCVILVQQLALLVTGTLRVSVTDPTPAALPSAAARAGNFLAFDVDGNPVVAAGVSGSPVSVAMQPVVNASTLALARTAMVVAKSGDNSDITSIAGVTTNTAAAAGKIGETISSTVAVGSAVALVNGVAKTVTFIDVTPGNWDITMSLGLKAGSNATVMGYCVSSISIVNNTQNATPGFFFAVSPRADTFNVLSIPAMGTGFAQVLVPTGSAVRYYLVAEAGFGTDTCSAYGFIQARRRF